MQFYYQLRLNLDTCGSATLASLQGVNFQTYKAISLLNSLHNSQFKDQTQPRISPYPSQFTPFATRQELPIPHVAGHLMNYTYFLTNKLSAFILDVSQCFFKVQVTQISKIFYYLHNLLLFISNDRLRSTFKSSRFMHPRF